MELKNNFVLVLPKIQLCGWLGVTDACGKALWSSGYRTGCYIWKISSIFGLLLAVWSGGSILIFWFSIWKMRIMMLTHLGKALGNLQMNVATHQQILTIARVEEKMKQRLPHTYFYFFVHVKLLCREWCS